MATAVTAIKALHEHDNVGVARNLAAAAAIDALKTSLDRGDFGRFCEDTLQISASYRARLLKLNKVREHVSSAQAWAATQKHRLTECQSAQNLIELVNDWLKRDEPPKPKAASKRQEAQSGQDDATESESAIQEGADLVGECNKTISELKSELANRDDAISDLQRRLARVRIARTSSPYAILYRAKRVSKPYSLWPRPANMNSQRSPSVVTGVRAISDASSKIEPRCNFG